MVPVGLLAWVLIFALRALHHRGKPPARQATASLLDLLRLAWSVGCYGVLVTLLLVPVVATTGRLPWAVSWLLGLLAFGASLLLLVQAPIWLAWRLARPLGLPRLARLLFWLSPATREQDGTGFAGLVATALGRPAPAGAAEAAGAWSACAAALQAERHADPAHADRIVAALATLPPGARFPRAARVVGVECLCRAAAERGDWEAVRRRAGLGRGRGVRSLRLLAERHLTGGVSGGALRATWLLAPSRRRSLRLLRAALGADPPRARGAGPVALVARRSGPWGLHLSLLADAAAGRAPSGAELRRLVQSWDAQLDAYALARIRARGLELGARKPGAAALALRDAILEQLDALAATARGPLPPLPDRPLGVDLARRSRDRLFRALEPFHARAARQFSDLGPPLREWEQWLRLREAVDAVESALGSEGLRTAWHAGLRGTAWNWPCKLLNFDERRGAWASLTMFAWVAALAAQVGDEEAASVNRRNQEVARAAAART